MKLHNDSKDSEKSKYLIKLKVVHQKGRETERFLFRSLSWQKGDWHYLHSYLHSY